MTASASPATARGTASPTASPAIRPATSAGPASRSRLPSSTTSACSGPSARALATTSGPMPRGSPSVTARRGRRATASGAGVDVGSAAQDLEIVLHRELLAHVLADPVLHVVEAQLTLGQAFRELEHDELGPLRVRPHLEHRLQAGDGDRKSVV